MANAGEYRWHAAAGMVTVRAGEGGRRAVGRPKQAACGVVAGNSWYQHANRVCVVRKRLLAGRHGGGRW